MVHSTFTSLSKIAHATLIVCVSVNILLLFWGGGTFALNCVQLGSIAMGALGKTMICVFMNKQCCLLQKSFLCV